MLQDLLADRFKLAVHHEAKEVPVYALSVGKGGPKIHESKPNEIDQGGTKGYQGLVARGRVEEGCWRSVA